MNFQDYDLKRLDGLGFSEDAIKNLDFACWANYKKVGMKKKGNRMVPDCVKKSEHKEGDTTTDEMTPNYLPDEPGYGDEKNPQMAEGIRMPRMEEIRKAANKNGQLAMHASANGNTYSEFFQSSENNGGMIITQLRVAQEKIEIMLDMLDADDNLPPWAATKIANAGVALSSVGDYVRFGEEG